MQVHAIHPLKMSLHPLGICKICKISMWINPLKNVWHTITFICCLFWKAIGGNNSFSKNCIYARGFLQCYRLHYEIKVLILWSWQRCLIHLCLHYTHTHTHARAHSRPICIMEHYIHICTHTGSHCTLCVHGLTTGLAEM